MFTCWGWLFQYLSLIMVLFIENIINTDSDYSWYDLIDKELGQLKSPIAQTITKNAGGEIAELFSDIVYRRNRIIHSLESLHLKMSKF